MKMRKIIALMMAVLMLCSILPLAALAEGETTATISFADKANRTEYSTDKQVWVQNGITVTNDKAASTSNVGDYAAPARFYKGSNLTIACAGMTTVVITCNSDKSNGPTDLQNSIVTEGATVAVDGMVVTVTLASAVDTLAFENLTGQVRVDEITVTTTSAAGEDPAPETPAEPAEGTITFDDVAKRTEFSTEKQVWTENGVTVTNEKAASTSNVADYKAPVRFYASSSLKIEFPGMTKLVVNLNSGKPASGLTNALAAMEGITVTEAGYVVTIEFAEATDALLIEKLAGQIRVDSMTAYAGTTGSETPEQPEVPETLAEQIEEAKKLANKQYLPYESTITGTITDDPAASSYTEGAYKFTVTDGTNTLLCYYTPVTGGVPAKGDLVTVTGKLTAYNGTAQFDSTASAVVTKVPATLAEQIEEANKLANGAYLPYESTITGTITDDPAASSYTEGAYKFTVTDGTNTLLCYYTPVTGGVPAKGDSVTVTGKLTAYNGAAQFDSTASAVVTKNENPENPEQPEQPEEPETPATGVVTTPVAGTAYKFGMVQGKVSTTDVYYLIGGMNGYYMATGTDVAAAIDVYLEETEGGYYLYTLVDGAKTYINMVVSADGAHVNGAYEATASTVYTYNAEKKTVVANINGDDYWFGTRNDKTYTTVGPVKVAYEGFYCQFYGAAVEEEPENPGTGSDVPVTGDFALIAIGSLMAMSAAAVVLLKKKEF